VRDAIQSDGWARWQSYTYCVVYVDVTLTRSNVKVKVTDLLKFRKFPRWPRLLYSIVIVTAGWPQQAVHAGGDDRQPACGAFWFGSMRHIKLASSQLLGARKYRPIVLYRIVFISEKNTDLNLHKIFVCKSMPTVFSRFCVTLPKHHNALSRDLREMQVVPSESTVKPRAQSQTFVVDDKVQQI